MSTSDNGALSLPLQQMEQAALGMLEAVRMARGLGNSAPATVTGPGTVTDLANEFLHSKAKSGRSERYLKLCMGS